jgi:hypothetical protein
MIITKKNVFTEGNLIFLRDGISIMKRNILLNKKRQNNIPEIEKPFCNRLIPK